MPDAIQAILRRFKKNEPVRTAIPDTPSSFAVPAGSKLRFYLGLGLIGLSYATCWPIIALLGAVSIQLKEPLLLTIGGAVAYCFSHVLFILGAYWVGADRVKAFFRWATRRLLDRVFKAPGAFPGRER